MSHQFRLRNCVLKRFVCRNPELTEAAEQNQYAVDYTGSILFLYHLSHTITRSIHFICIHTNMTLSGTLRWLPKVFSQVEVRTLSRPVKFFQLVHACLYGPVH